MGEGFSLNGWRLASLGVWSGVVAFAVAAAGRHFQRDISRAKFQEGGRDEDQSNEAPPARKGDAGTAYR